MDEQPRHSVEVRGQQILVDQLKRILQRVDRLPVLDSRTPVEILGYDDHGIPH